MPPGCGNGRQCTAKVHADRWCGQAVGAVGLFRAGAVGGCTRLQEVAVWQVDPGNLKHDEGEVGRRGAPHSHAGFWGRGWEDRCASVPIERRGLRARTARSARGFWVGGDLLGFLWGFFFAGADFWVWGCCARGPGAGDRGGAMKSPGGAACQARFWALVVFLGGRPTGRRALSMLRRFAVRRVQSSVP